MTWTFSHCPNDAIDGCQGCPAICDDQGKPKADQCAAVFVKDAPRPMLSADLSTAVIAQSRVRDELDASAMGESWMEATIDTLVPTPKVATPQPGWAITRATVPDGQEQSATKTVTLWELDKPRAFYLLQRDSANFTIITMVRVAAPLIMPRLDGDHGHH